MGKGESRRTVLVVGGSRYQAERRICLAFRKHGREKNANSLYTVMDTQSRQSSCMNRQPSSHRGHVTGVGDHWLATGIGPKIKRVRDHWLAAGIGPYQAAQFM